MAELIYPRETEIRGPWILNELQLEKLHEIIEEIKTNIFVKYPSNENHSKVILKSKRGKIIEDYSIIGILKDNKIDDFLPSELLIEIKTEEYEFKFEITSDDIGWLYTTDNFEDLKISTDIKHKIKTWTRENKPKWIVQKWAQFGIQSVIISFFVLMFLTVFLDDSITRLEAYKLELVKETHNLLDIGITNDNLPKSIELLLKYQSSYVPTSFVFEEVSNKIIGKLWLIFLICSVIILLRPKTVIGLGKKKKWVWIYKGWIHLVTFAIPLTIIGFFKDYIRDYFFVGF